MTRMMWLRLGWLPQRRRRAHCMITPQLETFAVQILLDPFGKSQLLLQLISILSLKERSRPYAPMCQICCCSVHAPNFALVPSSHSSELHCLGARAMSCKPCSALAIRMRPIDPGRKKKPNKEKKKKKQQKQVRSAPSNGARNKARRAHRANHVTQTEPTRVLRTRADAIISEYADGPCPFCHEQPPKGNTRPSYDTSDLPSKKITAAVLRPTFLHQDVEFGGMGLVRCFVVSACSSWVDSTYWMPKLHSEGQDKRSCHLG